jgi:hypothetical protein
MKSKRLIFFFILLVSTFAEASLEQNCLCYLKASSVSKSMVNGGDVPLSPEYKNCQNLYSDAWKTYSHHDVYTGFDEYLKKEDFEKKNENKVCSRKDLKKWFSEYKTGQQEDLANIENKVMETYCDLKSKEKPESKHQKCFDGLIKLIDDSVVKSLKEECSDNNLNKTKKTKKSCVEIEKSKYIFEVDSSDAVKKVYQEICKKSNEANDVCIDGVTKESSKLDCSDLSELQTKESQQLCRKLVLNPLITSLNDQDAFKTCTNATSNSKEKAACFTASGAKAGDFGGDGIDDMIDGMMDKIKHVFDKPESADTYSHTPLKEITGETNLSETDKTDFKSRLKGKI